MSYFNTLLQRGGAYAYTPKEEEATARALEIIAEKMPLMRDLKQNYINKLNDFVRLLDNADEEYTADQDGMEDLKALIRSLQDLYNKALDLFKKYNAIIEPILKIPYYKGEGVELLEEKDLINAKERLYELTDLYKELYEKIKRGESEGRGAGHISSSMYPYIHNAMGPSPKLIF